MLTRYMGMTPKSQSYLFTFGLALCLLAMVLTDMWLPIVAGTFIRLKRGFGWRTLFQCMKKYVRCRNNLTNSNLKFAH